MEGPVSVTERQEVLLSDGEARGVKQLGFWTIGFFLKKMIEARKSHSGKEKKKKKTKSPVVPKGSVWENKRRQKSLRY